MGNGVPTDVSHGAREHETVLIGQRALLSSVDSATSEISAAKAESR